MTEVASSCGSSATRESKRHWSANLTVIPFPHRIWLHICCSGISSLIPFMFSCMFYHISPLPSVEATTEAAERCESRSPVYCWSAWLFIGNGLSMRHCRLESHSTCQGCSGHFVASIQSAEVMETLRKHLCTYIFYIFLLCKLTAFIYRVDLTCWFCLISLMQRPHPWGLLITFIELIKNGRYQFWPLVLVEVFVVWHSGSFWERSLSDSGSLGLGW